MLKVRKYHIFLFLALFLCSIAYNAEGKTSHKISVFGSSVASGSVAQDNHGYWYMLKDCLANRHWQVSSCSRGGDNTIRILERFDDLISQKPDYVFIGLSLANEGIRNQGTEAKEKVYNQYISGMKSLITMMRNKNMIPVVGLCYPHGDYTPQEYDYVKRMNLLFNTWDVPSANFLGAIEDGHGRWVDGFDNDPGHPNTAGHREMFYAIVPTLFDALEAGKTIPQKAQGSAFLTLGESNQSVVTYKPQDTIHSWATAFSFRCKQDGALAYIGGDKSNIDIIVKDGKIACLLPHQQEISTDIKVNDDKWHSLAVSHLYAQRQIQLFLDGQFVGMATDQLEPKVFTLGGGRLPLPQADFKDWYVYRAALNDLEAKALAAGQLLQASLEVYAPLHDTEFTDCKPVENRAQSMSLAIFKSIAQDIADSIAEQAQKYILTPADSTVFPAAIYKAVGNITGQEGLLLDDGKAAVMRYNNDGEKPYIILDMGRASASGYPVFKIKSHSGVPVLRLAYSNHPAACGETGDFARGSCTYLGVDLPVLPANPGRYELYSIPRDGTFIAPLIQGQQRYVRMQLDTVNTELEIESFCIVNKDVHDLSPATGHFLCSNETINKIWYASAWTLQIASFPNHNAWTNINGWLIPRKLERANDVGLCKVGAEWIDYTFDFDFEIRTNPDHISHAGWAFRASDQGNCYVASIDLNSVFTLKKK